MWQGWLLNLVSSSQRKGYHGQFERWPAGVVGGVILVMAALCFPFVLLGIGIIVIALALIPELFKRNKKALNAST